MAERLTEGVSGLFKEYEAKAFGYGLMESKLDAMRGTVESVRKSGQREVLNVTHQFSQERERLTNENKKLNEEVHKLIRISEIPEHIGREEFIATCAKTGNLHGLSLFFDKFGMSKEEAGIRPDETNSTILRMKKGGFVLK